MIKKIIINPNLLVRLRKFKLKQFVKRGGKIQKIKAQKAPSTFKNVEAQAAQNKFVKTFGENPGFGSGRGLRIEEASELGGRELAASTARAKWNKQITKFVTRKRSTLAGRVKSFRQQTGVKKIAVLKKGLKKRKVEEYNKALTSADTKAKSVYQKTHLLFTGKSGTDPLKHKLVETKFITTKKFRKGRPDKSMMPDKQYSKMERGAYGQKRRMAEFANLPGNKTKQGEVMWKKFWKKEGPRQKKYIEGQRKMYKEFFKKKK